jgi:hypothetical protein
MDNGLYQLLGTVVGGILTFCGGLGFAYWNRSSTRRQEHNKIIREKLEEVGNLAQQTLVWADEMFHEVATMFLAPRSTESPTKRKVNPARQLALIVRMYCPELTSDSQNFVKQIDLFPKAWTEFLILPNEERTRNLTRLWFLDLILSVRPGTNRVFRIG